MQYIILLTLHNSIPHTKWLKQQQLFSCSSRGWIFEIKTAPRLVTVGALPGLQTAPLFLSSACAHRVGKWGKELGSLLSLACMCVLRHV